MPRAERMARSDRASPKDSPQTPASTQYTARPASHLPARAAQQAPRPTSKRQLGQPFSSIASLLNDAAVSLGSLDPPVERVATRATREAVADLMAAEQEKYEGRRVELDLLTASYTEMLKVSLDRPSDVDPRAVQEHLWQLLQCEYACDQASSSVQSERQMALHFMSLAKCTRHPEEAHAQPL